MGTHTVPSHPPPGTGPRPKVTVLGHSALGTQPQEVAGSCGMHASPGTRGLSVALGSCRGPSPPLLQARGLWAKPCPWVPSLESCCRAPGLCPAMGSLIWGSSRPDTSLGGTRSPGPAARKPVCWGRPSPALPAQAAELAVHKSAFYLAGGGGRRQRGVLVSGQEVFAAPPPGQQTALMCPEGEEAAAVGGGCRLRFPACPSEWTSVAKSFPQARPGSRQAGPHAGRRRTGPGPVLRVRVSGSQGVHGPAPSFSALPPCSSLETQGKLGQAGAGRSSCQGPRLHSGPHLGRQGAAAISAPGRRLLL